MVLGGGPVGLLAAAVLRVRGLRTVVVGREAAIDLRARIATQLGAEYVSVEKSSLLDCRSRLGYPDIVIEATGSAQGRLRRDGDPRPERRAVPALSVTGGDA